MNLVLKPTEACNFSCTFCSSSYLVDDKKARLNLSYVFEFLTRFPKTESIFVVGGDPLMMPVDYYWEIIKYIEDNNLPTILSFTTNLWDFYKNPDKWVELFKHPRLEIGTSFQYGNGRQITPGKVFTEDIFIDVYNVFKSKIGKELSFLAVIDESNKAEAIKHVLLAKKLKTQCRLVYANQSGRSGDVYPISNMIDIYIQIWKMGLSEYEQSCYMVSEKLSNIKVGCPIGRDCDTYMRSINPDGRYFSCGPMNDDLDVKHEIDFKKEMAGSFERPILKSEHKVLKDECYGCKMFEVCNGCAKHIKDLKNTNKVEIHCTKMKSIEKDLFEMVDSKAMKANFRKVQEEF